MTLRSMPSTLGRLCFCVLTTLVVACGDEAPDRQFDNTINIGFDDTQGGCSQLSFPLDQPDLSALEPPIFLLTNIRSQQSSVGQAQASPGEPIEAEIWVNRATRQVKIELANAWSDDDVIYTTEEQTTGNEILAVQLQSNETVRGRYYMRLTLCGSDCDERAVVFDLHPCPDDEEDDEPCRVNAPYDRTLIEDGEIVRIDGTCVDLGTTPGVGSGTVLIQ